MTKLKMVFNIDTGEDTSPETIDGLRQDMQINAEMLLSEYIDATIKVT